MRTHTLYNTPCPNFVVPHQLINTIYSVCLIYATQYRKDRKIIQNLNFHYTIYVAQLQHKKLCHRVNGIYFFSVFTFIDHYFIPKLANLCPRAGICIYFTLLLQHYNLLGRGHGINAHVSSPLTLQMLHTKCGKISLVVLQKMLTDDGQRIGLLSNSGDLK